MFLQKKKGKFNHAVMIAMAVVSSFVCCTRGMAICLCDDDPDNCGEACHECHDEHSEEECIHLEFSAVDQNVATTTISFQLPEFCLMRSVEPNFRIVKFFSKSVNSTAPPLSPQDTFLSYSLRLMPRS